MSNFSLKLIASYLLCSHLARRTDTLDHIWLKSSRRQNKARHANHLQWWKPTSAEINFRRCCCCCLWSFTFSSVCVCERAQIWKNQKWLYKQDKRRIHSIVRYSAHAHSARIVLMHNTQAEKWTDSSAASYSIHLICNAHNERFKIYLSYKHCSQHTHTHDTSDTCMYAVHAHKCIVSRICERADLDTMGNA